jgi:hypothetical protein
MITLQDLKSGDVLIQCAGEPWKTGCNVFTGHPFPHAMMVSKIGVPVPDHFSGFTPNDVYVIEDGGSGVTEHLFDPVGNGWTTFPLDHFEVWRPRCDDTIKQAAITWARSRMGEGYSYGHLAIILALYRIRGSQSQPGWDDDPQYDNRKKVCSELIAMAFYRSGYDLVPLISDSNTMPWDLRNPVTCDFIGI